MKLRSPQKAKIRMNNRWYTVLIAAFIAGCQSLEVREEKTGDIEPYGLWKCTVISAYSCFLSWKFEMQPGWNHVKPNCKPFYEDDEVAEIIGSVIYFDLRSSDYTFRDDSEAAPESMKYVGDTWMFATDYGFASGYIDPEKKIWMAHFGTMQTFFGYNYWEGTCEDITNQPPEKPTEGEDTPAKD